MKTLVIVLSVILALMLCAVAVRRLLPTRDGAPAQTAAAAQESAPEPEKESEPETEPEPEPEEPEEPAEPLDHEAIQAEIERISEKYYATGTQVAIINDGEVIDEYACGWATVGVDPMTTEHKIRVASVSKVIVGMTAMLLQEDGTVDLDEDIGTYWGVEARSPNYPNIPVTIRMILNHTSTISGPDDLVGSSSYNIRSQLMYSYTGAKPGDMSSWFYNNYAFGVLGATLEVAAGKLVDDVLKEKLFKEMDIDASFAYGDVEHPELLATLYRGGMEEHSVWLQQSIHLYPTPGENAIYYAGGLTISAGDLAKLIALLANDGVYEGKQMLRPESVEQMEEYDDEPLSDGSYQAHPLIYVPDIYGRKGVYYHPGTAYGVFSCVCYDPETGDGVVVVTTGASGAADRYEIYSVCDEINEYIFDIISHPIDTSAGKNPSYLGG